VFAVLLAACGAGGTKEARQPQPIAHDKPRASAPHGPPRLAMNRIARVPAGTFGPYLGMRAEGGLALWASGEAGGVQSWFARPLSAAGEPSGEASRIGEAPSQLGLVTVRPLHEGFALLSTHKTSDGEVLDLSILSAAGARLTGPTSLGRSERTLLWIEAIPSPRGEQVLWAASSGGKAEIWSAQVTDKGELGGSPHLLARDAGAWQAVAFGAGVALSVTHVGKGKTHGPIELSLINGPEVAPPIVVNPEISADLDLDMASLGDRLVLAWSDHRGGENRVFSAAVDASGKIIAGAAPATPPLGEQAVLRVVPPASGSQRGYLAWESLAAPVAHYRSFEIAEFQGNGRVSSPRGTFEYWKMDGSMPEIAATPGGVAALTLAPICARGAECTESSPVAPEFVEFDLGFAVHGTEPLWPEGAASPLSLAWDLVCPGSTCFALSAQSGLPAAVGLTRLEHLSETYRTPAERVELPPPPRVVSDEALAETAPLSQIAWTQTNAGSLLAWLTDFDPTTPWVKLKKPTTDGRYEPLRARIDVQSFAASEPFSALAGPETLSLRAHSLGGVALSGSPAQPDTLAAWAGLDGGQPQVFLTLLDKFGKKLTQRMLTHKNGELSDLALTPSGKDYLIAWVDERSADPEVYATKVNHALSRIAPEQRITQARGAATDLSLVPTGTGALLVWADARESELAGSSDIYAAALRGSDAARTANETCLQKTRGNSFGPVARAYGTGALVAWLESAAENGSGEAAHANLAVLDDAGRVVGSVQSVAVGSGTPITVGLDCSQEVCHAVVAVDENARSALYAVTVRDGRASNAVRIRSSSNAPSSVAPLVHEGSVYVAEVQQDRAHLRRLLLEW
jgi:hypothetical protein